MIQGTSSQHLQDSFSKLKAITPSTAESFVFSPTFTEIYDSTHSQLANQPKTQGTLFTILQQRFESKVDDREESKTQNTNLKNTVQENLQQCQFKIVIKIVQQKGNLIKSFSKKIIKTIESNDEITLIFDRQHQKLRIDTNTKYVMEIFLQTLDGFSKRIWEQKFVLEENSRKWSVMTIPSENNDKFFNMEVEKIGKFFVKPLSLKLPSSAIEEFLDYKLKLLNKSQLLSSLKSISQLKGILLPLTKQNMGSRIIQKLLTKASQSQIQQVMIELKPIFKEMILDRYGNYVFQKIFKMATKLQKKKCLKSLQPYLIELLVSKEGTHCIQTLVDCLEAEQTIGLFEGFSEEQIFYLSTNKFSMHFIQKLLVAMGGEKLAYMLIGRFSQLAVDKQGIVVLKALMNYSASSQDIRYSILFSCQQCFYEIAYAEFGHYIIEEMFLYYNYYELIYVLGFIIGSICELAQNQYSSSIVRKAIETFGDYVSISMITRIVEGGLAEMMECPSGEFVLHRLMELTMDEKAKLLLMNKMMVLSQVVKCYQKRVKWMKYFKLI